jgi:hypothetical protein
MTNIPYELQPWCMTCNKKYPLDNPNEFNKWTYIYIQKCRVTSDKLGKKLSESIKYYCNECSKL